MEMQKNQIEDGSRDVGNPTTNYSHKTRKDNRDVKSHA
jgi:hypothetical protein